MGTNWECSVCLTENDHINRKTNEPRYDCEACEAERPGYTKPGTMINNDTTSTIGGAGAALLFGSKPTEQSSSAPVFGATAEPVFGASASKPAEPIFGATTSNPSAEPVFGTKKSEAPSGLNALFGGSTPTEASSTVTFGIKEPITPAKSLIVGSNSAKNASVTPIKSIGESDTDFLTQGSSKVSARIEHDRIESLTSFAEDGNVKNGKILVWGSGECDQLPFSEDVLGDSGIMVATGVDKLNKYDLLDVKCGALHTVVLIDDGRVATFGCNDDGALGRVVKDSSKERFPGVVKFSNGGFLEQAIAISAGNGHSAVLKSDGSVIVMGGYKASSGAKARVNDTKEPSKVDLPHPGFAIASGNEHTIALCKDSDNEVCVYGWGVNEYGTLAKPMEDNPTDEQMKASLVPVRLTVPEGHKIVKAYAGGNVTAIHTVEKESGSNVYFAVGCNGTGEVGVDSQETVIDQWAEIKPFRGMNIKKITLAECSGKAITDKGDLYAWGHPDYLGRENPPSNPKSREPIRSPERILGIPAFRNLFSGGRTNFGVKLYGDRSTYGWGDSMTGQLMDELDAPLYVPTAIKNLGGKIVISIAAGSQHCAAIVAEPAEVKKPEAPSRKRARSASVEGTGASKPTKRAKETKDETVRSTPYPQRERKQVSKF